MGHKGLEDVRLRYFTNNENNNSMRKSINKRKPYSQQILWGVESDLTKKIRARYQKRLKEDKEIKTDPQEIKFLIEKDMNQPKFGEKSINEDENSLIVFDNEFARKIIPD